MPPNRRSSRSLDLAAKPLLVRFKPRSASQEAALRAYRDSDVIFLLGPAGVGKSHAAIGAACQDLASSPSKKLLLLRPAVEAGRSLGHLPGTLEEKIDPFMGAFKQLLKKVALNLPPERISFEAVGFQRGMAQPLNAPILTEYGYRSMGTILPGDLIVAGDGSLVPVLSIHPQGTKPIYRFTFSDGSFADSCPDHLWATRTISEKKRRIGFSVKTTSEIIDTLRVPSGQNNHTFPLLSSPIAFVRQDVTIDPYLLGLLLGDGCLSDKCSIRFTTADEHLAAEVSSRLPYPVRLKQQKGYDYVLSHDLASRKNPLKEAVRGYNLIGRKSHDKFIPDEFKFNSPDVRLEVLRGLLDTDGCVSEHNSGTSRVEYSSTSRQLANDVAFLVQSLGGIARCRIRPAGRPSRCRDHVVVPKHSSHYLDILLPSRINPFRLKRKAERFNRTRKPYRVLRNVSFVGHNECQCIRIAHPDHLYLTNDCIVTHNTYENSVVVVDEAQNLSCSQLVMLLTRLGPNAKLIFLGDPSQSDIRPTVGSEYDCDLDAVVDSLEGLERVSVVDFDPRESLRHPLIARMLARLSHLHTN